MTTAPAPAAAPAPAKKKRTWRWLRIAGPLALVLVVLIGSAVVHALQQASPGDKDYLNPGSTAGIGSSRLADAPRAKGVAVTRVTTTYEASSTFWAQPDSTLFVTAPEFTDVKHLTESRWYPPGSRIVLVRPDDKFLGYNVWPVSVKGETWTASAPEPDCKAFTAAAAVRKRYYTAMGNVSCYDGGAVQFRVGLATVTAVGAADPFRNDRLDEHGNRDFAVDLLGGKSQVIWLDLHRQDTWPTSNGPVVTDRPAPDGGGGQSTPDPTFTTDDPGDGDGSPTPGDGSSAQGGSGSDRQPRSHEPDGAAQNARQQAETFPPQVWAVVVLILLALGAFALAAARRLGTPVAERLPSRVPANETMLGHGRLYQRGGSRSPSLRILKQNARRRLTDHLGLSPAATDEALAAATGLPVERFTEVFSSNYRLENDRDLVAITRQLQNLMRDAMNAAPDNNEGN